MIWGLKNPYKFDDKAKLFVEWLCDWSVSVIVITWGQVMVYVWECDNSIKWELL